MGQSSDGVDAPSSGCVPSPTRRTLATAMLVCAMAFVIALVILPMGCDSEEPPYDFEWRTPIPMPNVTGYTSWGITVDGRTGDTYCIDVEFDAYNTSGYLLTYYRYDAEGDLLELAGSSWVPSLYSNIYWSYIIFGGHLYTFYQDFSTRDKLHLSMDGSTSDPLNLTLPSLSNVRVLGSYEDDILLEVIYHDFQNGGWVFALYSVNADTLNLTKRTMFSYSSSSLHSLTSFFRHGAYYWTQNVENTTEADPSLRYQTIMYIYDIENARTAGPIILTKESGDPQVVHYYPYDVDTHGDIHVLDPQHSKLSRFSPAGDLLGEVSIPPPPYDGINYSVQWSNILINASDRVFLFGTLSSGFQWYYDNIITTVIDREYQDVPTPRLLNPGLQFVYSMGTPVINRTDTIFLILSCHDVTTYDGLTYQIPLTPDLTVDPATYRLDETRGDPEPVMISFNVSNVGWAPSERFVASVLERANASSDYSPIGVFSCDDALSRDEAAAFTMRTRLSHGAHWIKIVVHDVSPYENNRLNNALEVLAYVNMNTPPDLTVALPENGTVCDERALASGTSSDFDGDAPLTIYVTGLPRPVPSAVGPGEWGLEVGLGDVPSGDYWLSFVAFDGMDFSPPEHRLVRIDRPQDSLTLRSFSPGGDVSLIVGEVAAFSIHVTERLSRPISYTWTLDGVTVASGSPSHVLEGLQAGTHALTVGASSGLASLEHGWSISVRSLVAPTIAPVSPDHSLTLGKRTVQTFEVAITNPDEVQYAVLWLSDGALLSRERETSRRISFDRSGDHTVSALLRWGTGEAEASWDVTVLNSPPRLVSWSPDGDITILEETDIELSVGVEDDDGDELDYRWEASGLAVGADGIAHLNLTCPYTPGVNRTVRVTASDGESTVSRTWTIVSPSKSEPPPTAPHSTRPDTTWLLLALILGVGSALTVGFHLGRRRWG